jgi:hypothetical protein
MYCHCTRCRKATGRPHAANGFVKANAFRWTQGARPLKRYDLPDSGAVRAAILQQLRLAVPRINARSTPGWSIPAGSLDEVPQMMPPGDRALGFARSPGTRIVPE